MTDIVDKITEIMKNLEPEAQIYYLPNMERLEHMLRVSSAVSLFKIARSLEVICDTLRGLEQNTRSGAR